MLLSNNLFFCFILSFLFQNTKNKAPKIRTGQTDNHKNLINSIVISENKKYTYHRISKITHNTTNNQISSLFFIICKKGSINFLLLEFMFNK